MRDEPVDGERETGERETVEPDLPGEAEEGGRGRDERFRQRLEAFVPDLLKRTFYAGLGAVFTSEDGARRLASEFSLPKEAVSFLLAQAQNTKSDLFRIVGRELRAFLENLNLNEEVKRLLSTLTIEIKTEVRFVPVSEKSEELEPEVRNRYRIRRVDPTPSEAKAETAPATPLEARDPSPSEAPGEPTA